MVWLRRSLLILVQSRQKYCGQSVCFVQGTATRLCWRHTFIIVRYHILAHAVDIFNIPEHDYRYSIWFVQLYVLAPPDLDLENPDVNLQYWHWILFICSTLIVCVVIMEGIEYLHNILWAIQVHMICHRLWTTVDVSWLNLDVLCDGLDFIPAIDFFHGDKTISLIYINRGQHFGWIRIRLIHQ